MSLVAPNMEDCNKKERCLSGPNAGLAYTPGSECGPNESFNQETCDCDVLCPTCDAGDPKDAELCSYTWTDERGRDFGISSSGGPPLISEPYSCGSTFCYFDLQARKCDGTYGTPTPNIGYCNGSGCADDGIQLTGPSPSSCINAGCDDALCPVANETFDCETCECVVDPCACTGDRIVIYWKAYYKERNTSCINEVTERVCQEFGASDLSLTTTISGLILGQEPEWVDNYDISANTNPTCGGTDMRGAVRVWRCLNGVLEQVTIQLGFPGCTVNGVQRGIHEYIIGGGKYITIGNVSGDCP